jgi:outer membrane protein assembly factor BamB
VVAADGTAYYTVGNTVQAVSSAGAGLWQAQAETFRHYTPLQISPAGDLLFLAEDVFDARDGRLLQLQSTVDPDAFFVGNDGRLYLRSQNTVMQWQLSVQGIEILQSAGWNYQDIVSSLTSPFQAGVTRQGIIWLLYTTPLGSSTSIAWVNLAGAVLGSISPDHPLSAAQVVGVRDQDTAAYLCGLKNRQQGSAKAAIACSAFVPGQSEPIWQAELGQSEEIKGGALAPGRLYLTTVEGKLYAVGEAEQAKPQVAAAPSGASPGIDDALSEPPTPEIAWVFKDASGFAGGPAVGVDGALYIGSRDGTLYALDHDGKVRWTAALPATPVGPPAVGANGDVYQADKQGGLSCFTSAGAACWLFQPAEGAPSTVGPLVGPDGTVYYTIGSSVQAVSPAGEALWRTRSRTSRSYLPLQLSVTGEWLLYGDDIFVTADGRLLDPDEPVEVDQYFAGKDGRLYLRNDHTVMQWEPKASQIEIVQTAQWDYTKFVGSATPPSTAGVTRAGVIWLAYTSWETAIAWLDATGLVLGTARDSVSDAQLISVLDSDGTALLCGTGAVGGSRAKVQCKAFSPGAPLSQESERQRFQEPVWQVSLEPTAQGEYIGTVVGGILVRGRLYVATSQGFLYAVGEK